MPRPTPETVPAKGERLMREMIAAHAAWTERRGELNHAPSPSNAHAECEIACEAAVADVQIATLNVITFAAEVANVAIWGEI